MTTFSDERVIFERHRDSEYPAHVTVYDDGRLEVDGWWDHSSLNPHAGSRPGAAAPVTART